MCIRDRPTGALDYRTGKQVLGLLQDTCRKTGRTVIVITLSLIHIFFLRHWGKRRGLEKSTTFTQKSDKLCETVKIWSRFCKKLTFS